MPLLLMIRHGENDYVKTGKLAGRIAGVHLNEKGQKQAQDLADSFSNIPVKAFFSSPLERAVETASPIAQKLGLPIQLHEGFVETGVGEWSGQELKKLRKLPVWKTVQGAPSRFRFPEGESFLECQTRIVNTVDSILSTFKDDEIIACISHGDPIKLLVAYHMGMPLDHFQRLGCDTASVTVLMFSSRGVTLVKLNQRPPFTFFPLPPKNKK